MNGINWTEIIIALCSLLITGIVIPFVRSKWKESQAKLNESERELIMSIVDTSVRWAKQWMQSETGEQKKAAVMHYVESKLHELGISVYDEDLSIIIESIYERVKKEAGTPAPLE